MNMDQKFIQAINYSTIKQNKTGGKESQFLTIPLMTNVDGVVGQMYVSKVEAHGPLVSTHNNKEPGAHLYGWHSQHLP